MTKNTPKKIEEIGEELIRAFLQYQAEMATKYDQDVLTSDPEFWNDKIVKDILAKLKESENKE